MMINLQSITPGSITAINHPAMPDLAQLRQRNGTDTWCLVQEGKLGAICSLWTENVSAVQGFKTAALGHFFAQEPKVGALLLDQVCQLLAAQGIEYVVGPMDGDTWHSYRLVADQGTAPPFFLEYYTPDDWPAIFLQSGFSPVATYCSAQTTMLDYTDRSADKFAARAAAMGLTVRPFDPNRAQEELTALYTLSVQSFAHNFLYTPIALADFLALYAKLLPYLVPEQVLLAEHAGRLVGVLFAVPDYQQQARGAPIDTLIIKTIARLPERRYAGLGSYLTQLAHRQAAAAGYKKVIHALMHDENASLTISNKTGSNKTGSNKSAEIIRRYVLYGKRI